MNFVNFLEMQNNILYNLFSKLQLVMYTSKSVTILAHADQFQHFFA